MGPLFRFLSRLGIDQLGACLHHLPQQLAQQHQALLLFIFTLSFRQ
jgi:hypothetical protein